MTDVYSDSSGSDIGDEPSDNIVVSYDKYGNKVVQHRQEIEDLKRAEDHAAYMKRMARAQLEYAKTGRAVEVAPSAVMPRCTPGEAAKKQQQTVLLKQRRQREQERVDQLKRDIERARFIKAINRGEDDARLLLTNEEASEAAKMRRMVEKELTHLQKEEERYRFVREAEKAVQVKKDRDDAERRRQQEEEDLLPWEREKIEKDRQKKLKEKDGKRSATQHHHLDPFSGAVAIGDSDDEDEFDPAMFARQVSATYREEAIDHRRLNRFERCVDILDDMFLDPESVHKARMDSFFKKHCAKFSAGDKQEGEFTHEEFELFRSFSDKMETVIKDTLGAKIGPQFSFEEFQEDLFENMDLVDNRVWEVLLSFTHFEIFAAIMEDHYMVQLAEVADAATLSSTADSERKSSKTTSSSTKRTDAGSDAASTTTIQSVKTTGSKAPLSTRSSGLGTNPAITEKSKSLGLGASVNSTAPSSVNGRPGMGGGQGTLGLPSQRKPQGGASIGGQALKELRSAPYVRKK